MSKIPDLGFKLNADVIARFISLPGKSVIDIGCGNMDFSRQMVEQRARVLAIDPDPVQAASNRAATMMPGLEFCETGADQLPVADESVEGVFFSYSLHHVPRAIYPQVFAEVRRVLRPTGFLYVIEPVDCPLNQVMRMFHDEEVARAAAWEALQVLAVPNFQTCEVVRYHSVTQYSTFEEFARHYASRSFNAGYSEADVRRASVRQAFERFAPRDGKFESPKNVMYLQGLIQ